MCTKVKIDAVTEIDLDSKNIWVELKAIIGVLNPKRKKQKKM